MAVVLVAGATGMTGRSLVEQLLQQNDKVRAIVRSPNKLPAHVLKDPNLTIAEASILDLTDEEMSEHVKGCDAVVSCLGHVVSFKGIFGQPRNLCTEATRRLCAAIAETRPSVPVKFILMNSVGVPNPSLHETRTLFDRGVLFLLRYLLPPHRDNETAAEHLYRAVGDDSEHIEWCCVRPDSLTNAEISSYEIAESPITGIFTGRPTARANVAKFMTELIAVDELWQKWRFRMPVVMDAEQAS